MTLINGLKPIVYAWSHAKLAYREPSGPSSNNILYKSQFIKFENDIDFGYVASYKEGIVFSFRGTDNTKGWISDFDVFPLKNEEYLEKHLKNGKWGSGTIHDGMYTAWLFFKSCINSIIRDFGLEDDQRMIIVTGHSRGAAFAELCSRHLAKNYGIPSSCFTYGGPAIGTKKYRDLFRSLPINGTRVVNGWDIVTRIPPHALGFRHGCANKVWNKKQWWKKFIPSLCIKDHKTESYDKFINKRFANK